MQRSCIAHCRPGFEAECARDVARIGAQAGPALVDCAWEAGGAYVVGTVANFDAGRWRRASEAAPPWFARSMFIAERTHELSPRDRVNPLLAIARQHEPPFAALWLETPDSDPGRLRSGLCRRLAPLLLDPARAAGLLAPDSDRRLHVLFVSGERVWVGVSDSASGSPWPMGIPRLALPRSAPSRSALKLAEALLTFLGPDARARLLRPGLRAVDLGAAPGGWTWQLVQRGLSVVAVDNGPLNGELARHPQVEHLRADGFHWRPRRPVDWMVCDIVAQPSRVAALIAAWVGEGACRRTIFNLKLPMKKRYAEVERCAEIMRETLDRRGLDYTLCFRQLYHDREEISGYCARLA